jgi:Protein of unknown function (DUF2911)
MQKKLWMVLTLLVLTLMISVSPLAAQDKAKRPSPPAQAQCKFSDGKTVTVDYSSPRVKGRKIFGGLVPYNEVWRAGANEATTFVTNTNLNVGGKDVPAGSYTIFAVPSPDKWTLVVSKKTGEWGVPYPGEGDDFTRTEMTASKTSAPVENFTIAFDQSGSKCTMRMEWENTRASVEVSEKK